MCTRSWVHANPASKSALRKALGTPGNCEIGRFIVWNVKDQETNLQANGEIDNALRRSRGCARGY
jgi:hypothetical protein